MQLLGDAETMSELGKAMSDLAKNAVAGMFAGWSAGSIAKGVKQTVGTYQSTEGQRVLDALDLAAPHPGDRNRPLELATEAGIAAAPWAAGKLVNTGMQAGLLFFSARKSRQVHRVLEPDGDLLGYAKSKVKIRTISTIEDLKHNGC